jgi:hypothetical protein
VSFQIKTISNFRHHGNAISEFTTLHRLLHPEHRNHQMTLLRTIDRQRMTLVVLLLMLTTLKLNAQNTPGARAAGLGGSYLVMYDAWSAMHNQAGLVHLTGISAGVFYENRFGLNELSDKGAVVAMPLGNSAFAVSYKSFGYSSFSTSKTSLAYALKLTDKFSFGLQFNYHNTRIAENYGNASGISFEGGFLYKMNDKLSLAGHLYNPTRAKLSDFNDERIPSLLRLGAGYRFSEKVSVTSEVRKASDAKASVRAGLEYQLIEQLALRAGFGSSPSHYSFGFGWKLKTFQLDVATGYHLVLGFTPQVSLTYVPGRK